jgi:hypothetical protein
MKTNQHPYQPWIVFEFQKGGRACVLLTEENLAESKSLLRLSPISTNPGDSMYFKVLGPSDLDKKQWERRMHTLFKKNYK